jgi:hypothetical protein
MPERKKRGSYSRKIPPLTAVGSVGVKFRFEAAKKGLLLGLAMGHVTVARLRGGCILVVKGVLTILVIAVRVLINLPTVHFSRARPKTSVQLCPKLSRCLDNILAAGGMLVMHSRIRVRAAEGFLTRTVSRSMAGD